MADPVRGEHPERFGQRGANPRGVAVRTLGCKVNRAESEAIAAELAGQGVELVGDDEAAVIVVNTCTVTGEADAKARKAVRRALAGAQGPLVVVTGCLAAIDPGGLRSLGERVVVAGDKADVRGIVADALGRSASGPAGVVARSEHLSARLASGSAGGHFRSRVAVKVQDGCDCHCTYCIVPRARGESRSVPLPEVTGHVSALARAGVAEVVLTGINVGRYRDPQTGAGLATLVREVAETGVARVRLSSVEPLDLTEELLGVMAAAPAFCRHLHVPLQSGSDSVLSAMGRLYRAREYAERIAAARAALSGVVVTTDVIAGFPGESVQDAAETLWLCEDLGLAKLHVFRFSARSGTPAAQMACEVPAEERAARAAALRGLSARLEAGLARSRVGSTLEVLVERAQKLPDGTRQVSGTSREYLQVACDSQLAQVGETLRVRAVRAEGARLFGRVE